jgi:hypothetical protein
MRRVAQIPLCLSRRGATNPVGRTKSASIWYVTKTIHALRGPRAKKKPSGSSLSIGRYIRATLFCPMNVSRVGSKTLDPECQLPDQEVDDAWKLYGHRCTWVANVSDQTRPSYFPIKLSVEYVCMEYYVTLSQLQALGRTLNTEVILPSGSWRHCFIKSIVSEKNITTLTPPPPAVHICAPTTDIRTSESVYLVYLEIQLTVRREDCWVYHCGYTGHLRITSNTTCQWTLSNSTTPSLNVPSTSFPFGTPIAETHVVVERIYLFHLSNVSSSSSTAEIKHDVLNNTTTVGNVTSENNITKRRTKNAQRHRQLSSR